MNNEGLFEWDIDLIENVLNSGDDELDSHVHIMNGNVGDVYCFWGNVSLHEVQKIEDKSGHPMPRQVIVTSFGTQQHFTHRLNSWDLTDTTDTDKQKQEL